jgi:hypothetical protein
MQALPIATLLTTLLLSIPIFASLNNCKESIKLTTCLVEKEFVYDRSKSYPENKLEQLSVPCLENTKVYAEKIYNLYDSLPDHSKEAFCYIKKIFIVPGDVDFGGRASTSFDSNTVVDNQRNLGAIGYKQNGFILELSKKFRFDRNESVVDYANRVMQGPFEVDLSSGEARHPNMPFYKYENDDMRSELYGTIVHEIGHFLDYSQNVNTFSVKLEDNGVGSVELEGWMKTSWNADWNGRWFDLTPKVSIRLAQRPYLLDDIEAIFKDLNSSAFVSFYSLTRPVEDFAEFYTRKNLLGNYSLYNSAGKPFYPNLKRAVEYYEKDALMEGYMSNGFKEILSQEVSWVFANNLHWELDRAHACQH